MKTYIVGGAVRDGLLGLPVQDRDHVVIGATPEEMLRQGYTPVGKDFPVFLHPVTHEEYALARTERKTAPGYKGFVFHTSPDVTLEEDLVRRDLTINAMARADDGSIVDPFNGQADLKEKRLRHVSPAFSEDPLRILRVARFAARFIDFTVAPETNALMRKMVEAGEVDALVPERVWQELARGLMEQKPSRMFEVLKECHALQRLFPELDALWDPSGQDFVTLHGIHLMDVVNLAAQFKSLLSIRFAALVHDLDAGETARENDDGRDQARRVRLVNAVCKRLKIPSDCRDLAVMTAREIMNVANALHLPAEELVALLERCDAFRKPQRFIEMLRTVERCHLMDTDSKNGNFPQSQYCETALSAAQGVNAGEIAAKVMQDHPGQPQRIADFIRTARVEAVAAAIGKK